MGPEEATYSQCPRDLAVSTQEAVFDVLAPQQLSVEVILMVGYHTHLVSAPLEFASEDAHLAFGAAECEALYKYDNPHNEPLMRLSYRSGKWARQLSRAVSDITSSKPQRSPA